MDQFIIQGGAPLRGDFYVAGAKNAVLPLMCASLLVDGCLTLSNVPSLLDIRTLSSLLTQHGVQIVERVDENKKNVKCAGKTFDFIGKDVSHFTAPYDLVKKMRASILVLGPLLARFREAKVSLPGGCAIGSRPVDLHIKGLEKMGAHIELEDGYILAKAPQGLQGADIVLPFPSVGATENLVMAATLARGTTHLSNVAREPEVGDLIDCLNKMGARIQGKGTDTLTIEGVESLHSAVHRVMSDRIEAGSLMMAAAATRGDLLIHDACLDDLGAVTEVLIEAGVSLKKEGDAVRVTAGELRGVDVMTKAYPGFPTDLQAQVMAMLTLAEGTSIITETIFENRFMHVAELIRMGALIHLDGSSAVVRGACSLRGAHVMATDLRASMSLIIAALAATGETVIDRIYHLDRGYECLEDKLNQCGADVKRVSS